MSNIDSTRAKRWRRCGIDWVEVEVAVFAILAASNQQENSAHDEGRAAYQPPDGDIMPPFKEKRPGNRNRTIEFNFATGRLWATWRRALTEGRLRP